MRVITIDAVSALEPTVSEQFVTRPHRSSPRQIVVQVGNLVLFVGDGQGKSLPEIEKVPTGRGEDAVIRRARYYHLSDGIHLVAEGDKCKHDLLVHLVVPAQKSREPWETSSGLVSQLIRTRGVLDTGSECRHGVLHLRCGSSVIFASSGNSFYSLSLRESGFDLSRVRTGMARSVAS